MPIKGKSASNPIESRWFARSERCRELVRLFPASEQILSFYAKVLDFQGKVAQQRDVTFRESESFLTQAKPSHLQQTLRELLDLVATSGPETLAARAKQLQQSVSFDGFFDIDTVSKPYEHDDFFRRACSQPWAEELQLQITITSKRTPMRCSVCNGLPQLSILRPEGEGGARWLQCSFCLREWLFRRLVCLWCGEEDKEKLPRYSAPELAHVALSACDTCKRYVKLIDMTKEGRAVPLVDEAAVAALDVWAAKNGYLKIVPNLLGF